MSLSSAMKTTLRGALATINLLQDEAHASCIKSHRKAAKQVSELIQQGVYTLNPIHCLIHKNNDLLFFLKVPKD